MSNEMSILEVWESMWGIVKEFGDNYLYRKSKAGKYKPWRCELFVNRIFTVEVSLRTEFVAAESKTGTEDLKKKTSVCCHEGFFSANPKLALQRKKPGRQRRMILLKFRPSAVKHNQGEMPSESIIYLRLGEWEKRNRYPRRVSSHEINEELLALKKGLQTLPDEKPEEVFVEDQRWQERIRNLSANLAQIDGELSKKPQNFFLYKMWREPYFLKYRNVFVDKELDWKHVEAQIILCLFQCRYLWSEEVLTFFYNFLFRYLTVIFPLKRFLKLGDLERKNAYHSTILDLVEKWVFSEYPKKWTSSIPYLVRRKAREEVVKHNEVGLEDGNVEIDLQRILTNAFFQKDRENSKNSKVGSSDQEEQDSDSPTVKSSGQEEKPGTKFPKGMSININDLIKERQKFKLPNPGNPREGKGPKKGINAKRTAIGLSERWDVPVRKVYRMRDGDDLKVDKTPRIRYPEIYTAESIRACDRKIKAEKKKKAALKKEIEADLKGVNFSGYSDRKEAVRKRIEAFRKKYYRDHKQKSQKRPGPILG